MLHLLFPRPAPDGIDDCHGHRFRHRLITLFSPPNRANSATRRFFFSMFYTAAHVFTFMNTIIYWAVMVPAGHGGFKVPKFPHHHHQHENGTDALYDPRESGFSWAVGTLLLRSFPPALAALLAY
jgi:hypothetical protein